MYKVVIADDEVWIGFGIKKLIHRSGLPFEVVGEASNGIKAYDMVRQVRPDILITDIRMPGLNGLELMKKLLEEGFVMKVVFISGYAEFEYAKEAVHLEVEEYILKPVNSVELINIFTKLKIKLDQEISERRSMEKLEHYYTESLPLLQANFCSTLIEGRIHEDELQKYLSDYQISLPGPLYCCLVIHMSSSQIPENMNSLFLAASVQKQAEDRLGKRWKAKCFPYLGNSVLFAQINNENEIAELTDDCDRFCKYVNRMMGTVVTVGIGQVCSQILDLAQSYNAAREAVSYRAVYGASRAINIKEIAPKESGEPCFTNDMELLNLFKKIRLNSEEEIVEAVDQYIESISFPLKSLQQHHVVIMELVTALFRFSVNNDIAAEGVGGDIGILYGKLLELEPDALRKWLTDISLCFSENLVTARSRSTQSFVSKAKEHVRSQYADVQLSLAQICERLGVSNSYFSTVFKKETGKSFVSYVTDYRMEQAARLLIETNEKSYVIAQKVGYTDPNYFSYVFKRKFGVSPSKYRAEHIKSEKQVFEK